MDFRLGDRSDQFRDEVREFIREHVTDTVVHEARRTGTVHNWELHRAMGEKGWLAASWPVDVGGQGRDPFEMTALHDELTRAAAPLDGWRTATVAATALRHVGTTQQKSEVLPRVLSGEILLCLGWTEPDCGSDVAAAKTRAERDGDGWRINGQKMFTTMAHEAAYVFLLARTNPDAAKHRGLTTFLVPMDSPGVEVQEVRTLFERTNITFYTDVWVPDTARVGEVDGGWDVMTVALTFERGGGYAGDLRRMMEKALEWARHPDPVTGSAPIDDPFVRERLARVAIDIEVAELLYARTAAITAAGGVPGIEGSMSKLFSSEAVVRTASDLIELTDSRGLLGHGQPDAAADGELEHYFRESPVRTITGGTSEIQRTIIAERALGLPRSR